MHIMLGSALRIENVGHGKKHFWRETFASPFSCGGVTAASHGGGFSLVADQPRLRGQLKGIRYTAYWSDGKSLQRSRLTGNVVSVEPAHSNDDGGDGAAFRNRIEVVPADELSPDEEELLRSVAKLDVDWKPYSRLFDMTKAPVWPIDSLEEVGVALTAQPSASQPTSECIPAAYTYFGQFIAHEISDIAQVSRPNAAFQLETARFDLGSIFNTNPPVNPLHSFWVDGVGVGQTANLEQYPSYMDLPRQETGMDWPGMALVGDSRNDSNLGIAQMHVAVSKFHQLVAMRGDTDPRRTTRRHLQAIVLFDYLKRISDPHVYSSVLAEGRKIVRPGPLDRNEPYLIPIEFAAACFRMGHSMVRDVYTGWGIFGHDAGLDELLNFTRLGGKLRDHRLPDEWAVDANAILGDERASIKALNNAKAIDSHVTHELGSFDKKWFTSGAHGFELADKLNLAIVTLLRGREYCIPSAQAIAESLSPSDRFLLPLLSPKDLLAAWQVGREADRLDHDLLRHLKMDDETPLWLYCLLEAQVSHCGQRLGPFASRIVCETIHAAIEADKDGIIRNGASINFHANESMSGLPTYSLYDLFQKIGAWPLAQSGRV